MYVNILIQGKSTFYQHWTYLRKDRTYHIILEKKALKISGRKKF